MSISLPVTGTHAAAPVRRRRGVLRILLRIVIGLLLFIGAAVLAAFVVSEQRARRRVTVPVHAITVRTDSATIARGARLARARFCSECHTESLAGQVMVDEPMIGRIAPPNLTNGRAAGVLTTDEWERAVRHGIRRDGSMLGIMPSHEFAELTDDDLAAIIAYARQLPASASRMPTTVAGPALRALDLAGQLTVYAAARIDHDAPHRAHLEPAATPAYGRYMASTCTGCHGPNLSGGKVPAAPPDWPPAANLTPAGLGHYTLASFTRVLRTGVRPDGSQVNDHMPWRFTRSLDDTEIAAIWAYLRTVPAREYGNR